MINNPPPLNGDYNRDSSTKALKRRGCINHGSTLRVSRVLSPNLIGETLNPDSGLISLGVELRLKVSDYH